MQKFNKTNSNALLIMVLLVAIIVCMVTVGELHGYGLVHKAAGSKATLDIVDGSRALAILLILVYGAYLYYSLISHRDLFISESDEDEDETVLGIYTALLIMAVLVGLISWLSDGMVAAIDGAAEHSGIPSLVICTFLIPNVNNAPEHAVAVLMAWHNKIDASISTSVGSAAQLGVFLLPFAMIADWVVGGTLDFGMEPILAGGLVLGSVFAYLVLSAGTSTWMHGILLLTLYAAIIGSFFLKSELAIDVPTIIADRSTWQLVDRPTLDRGFSGGAASAHPLVPKPSP